jgi:hypothetical protein
MVGEVSPGLVNMVAQQPERAVDLRVAWREVRAARPAEEWLEEPEALAGVAVEWAAGRR